MSAIRILPPTLVNRIAAGEVVERPSSVVKELVENAIDAGASRVSVALENGGKTLIQVRDDGGGMHRDELALAVMRHATSKLPSDDLLAIKCLGFRGEALPSIGSISRLCITSRRRGGEEGWRIEVEGGEMRDLLPAPAPFGTCVDVRDLFYATPARLKFLKTDKTEIQHAVDVIRRLAMAYPHISFTLTIDGRSALSVSAAQGDLLDARLARLGELLGREFTANALALGYTRDNAGLAGFAGLPTFNRGTSAEQYMFVNRRPVRDRLLLGAVKAAYQDVLAHDRHPVAVLFLEMLPEEVDVNVHPAKAEVRFRDGAAIRGMIVGGIRHALAEAGYRASTTVGAQALALLGKSHGHGFALPAQAGSPRPAAFSARAQAFFAPLSAEAAPQGELMEQEPCSPMARSHEEPAGMPEGGVAPSYPLGAARAQLHGTYIVAETQDGLVIVDQHAAHERLVYERMKEALAQSGIARQRLLLPEVVELGEAASERLLARAAELAELGLAVEAFGPGAVVVREAPAMLGEVNAQALIRDLADQLQEYGEALALKEKLEHFCGTLACHGSVRAGRLMNAQEMNALLRQMEKTPLSGQCNHGRPTYIELKRRDIERLFGRR